MIGGQRRLATSKLRMSELANLPGVSELDRPSDDELLAAVREAEERVRAGDLDAGEVVGFEILKRAEAINSALLIGECWRIISLAQNWRGDYRSAQSSCFKAIAALEETHASSSLAQALSLAGSNSARMGDTTEGLEYLNQAVDLAQQLGDKLIQSRVLSNLGIVYSLSRNYPRAIEAMRQAVELQSDSVERWVPMMNLGALYLESAAMRQDGEEGDDEIAQEELRISIGYSERACVHFKGQKNDTHLAVCYGNQGVALLRLGQLEQAEAMLEEERVISVRSGLRDTEEEALGYLGVLCLRKKDFSRAERLLIEALAVAEDNNGLESIARRWLDLSRLRELTGNFREALFCFQRFHDFTQRRFAEQAEARAEAFAVKLEIERARLGAELHRLRAAELSATNEKLAAEAKLLDRYANEDSLTGLANRRFLNARLAKAFSESAVSGSPMTVAIIDVDHFKLVNDNFSHAVGDQVLQQIARILTAQCRGRDLVARLGGEEFVIIFDAESSEDALPISERMRTAVERYDWGSLHDGLRLTVSIGLASRTTQDGPELLLAAADTALYAAKRDGRNRVRVFH